MEKDLTETSQEFIQAIERGKQIQLSKRGFASVARLIAMFYEGLKGMGLPEPLVYILTCNFASQAMETLVLNPAVQAQAEGKGGDGAAKLLTTPS